MTHAVGGGGQENMVALLENTFQYLETRIVAGVMGEEEMELVFG